MTLLFLWCYASLFTLDWKKKKKKVLEFLSDKELPEGRE